MTEGISFYQQRAQMRARRAGFIGGVVFFAIFCYLSYETGRLVQMVASAPGAQVCRAQVDDFNEMVNELRSSRAMQLPVKPAKKLPASALPGSH